MNPNLTTAYMANQVERNLFETKANQRSLLNEADDQAGRRSRTTQFRHQIALMLMSAGNRLEGHKSAVFPTRLDNTASPIK